MCVYSGPSSTGNTYVYKAISESTGLTWIADCCHRRNYEGKSLKSGVFLSHVELLRTKTMIDAGVRERRFYPLPNHDKESFGAYGVPVR